MILDNIRRSNFAILLLMLLILSVVYCVELYDDILPDKIKWNVSVLDGLPDLISTTTCTLISVLLVLLAGILLYYFDTKYFSFKTGENLLFLFWIVQIGGFAFLHSLTEVHFAVIFIILSYSTLFSIDNKSNRNYGKIFMSSMYLGIATIFYSHAAYFIIAHIIGVAQLKYPEYRDWVILLAGLLTPFYFAIFISFFVTGDWLYPLETVINNITPSFPLKSLDLSAVQYITVIFISVLVLIKWFAISKHLSGANQKVVSYDFIFLISLIISALIFIIFAPAGKSVLLITFVFSTSGLRVLFVKIKKRIIADILFIIIILLPLFNLLEILE